MQKKRLPQAPLQEARSALVENSQGENTHVLEAALEC